jgi:hypothetical protein
MVQTDKLYSYIRMGKALTPLLPLLVIETTASTVNLYCNSVWEKGPVPARSSPIPSLTPGFASKDRVRFEPNWQSVKTTA